ncbi:MAG: hypothetical protein RXP86_10830 [Acidilobus sp.]
MPVENARREFLVQGTTVGTAVLGSWEIAPRGAKACPEVVPQVRQVAEVAGQLRDLVPMVSAMATQPRVRRLHKASLTAPSLCLARGPAGLKPGPEGGGGALKGRRHEGPDDSPPCDAVLSEDYLHAEGA